MVLVSMGKFDRGLLAIFAFCLMFSLAGRDACAQQVGSPATRGVEIDQSRENKKEGPSPMTQAELQAAVMSFADTYGSTIVQAANLLQLEAQSPQTRLNAARMKFYSSAAAFEIGAGPYPGVSLLEMRVLVTLNRIVWENYWKPKVYGDSAEVMLRALRKLEGDIQTITAKVLTPVQQKELVELIQEWHKRNPDQVWVHHVRFSDFGEQLGRKPTLEKAVQPGGLLAPVKEAAQAAEQVRQTAERAMYLFSRLLIITNMQVELAYLGLVNKPEVQQLLSNATGFRETSERYAQILEQLPEQMAGVSNETINQLMQQVEVQRTAAIDHAMKEMSTLREVTIKEVMEQVPVVSEVMLDQLMKRVAVERKEAIDQAFAGLAQERKDLILEVVNLVDQGERKAGEGMNQAFVLGAGLIVIFFLAMFVYRYASQRLFRSRQE
jgi:uncharacterized protein YqgV (UPF0045/DUF77 family)